MRTYLLEDIVGDTPRFREHLSNMEREIFVLEKQMDEVQCQLKKKEETKQMESPVLRDSSGMELLSETGNLLRCVFDVFWREEMKRRETEKRLGRTKTALFGWVSGRIKDVKEIKKKQEKKKTKYDSEVSRMYLNKTDGESLDKYKKEYLANLFEYVCAIDTLWLDLQGGILDGVGEIVKLAATYQTDVSSYVSMLNTDAIRLREKRNMFAEEKKRLAWWIREKEKEMGAKTEDSRTEKRGYVFMRKKEGGPKRRVFLEVRDGVVCVTTNSKDGSVSIVAKKNIFLYKIEKDAKIEKCVQFSLTSSDDSLVFCVEEREEGEKWVSVLEKNQREYANRTIEDLSETDSTPTPQPGRGELYGGAVMKKESEGARLGWLSVLEGGVLFRPAVALEKNEEVLLEEIETLNKTNEKDFQTAQLVVAGSVYEFRIPHDSFGAVIESMESLLNRKRLVAASEEASGSCHCKALNNRLMQITVGMEASKLHDVLFGDKMEPLRRVQKQCGFKEIETDDWEMKHGEEVREQRYKVPIDSKFVKNDGECVGVFRKTSCGACFTVQNKTQTSGIPYGNTFSVLTQYSILPAKAKDRSVLVVSYEIEWNKKPFLSSVIEKSVKKNISLFSERLRQCISESCDVVVSAPEARDVVAHSVPFPWVWVFLSFLIAGFLSMFFVQKKRTGQHYVLCDVNRGIYELYQKQKHAGWKTRRAQRMHSKMEDKYEDVLQLKSKAQRMKSVISEMEAYIERAKYAMWLSERSQADPDSTEMKQELRRMLEGAGNIIEG